ncbi:MAG: hypothetical protein ACRKFN_02560 [Desulfitobacterium sp.]
MPRQSKMLSRSAQADQSLAFLKKIKNLRYPDEAVELLQQVIDQLAKADKHSLQQLILDLRQAADDIRYKHYKARCLYTLIPPEDALAFWICYVLGSLPEDIRFANFSGEVLELLKILSLADRGSYGSRKAPWSKIVGPIHELDLALALIKEEYPIFFHSVTEDPLLVPLLDFGLKEKEGNLMTVPRLHCLGIFKPNRGGEGSLIPILHALTHILHHALTEDPQVIPPGFLNMYQEIFDDCLRSSGEWEEIFAEIFIASLLYETEYMSLVAYMELCQEDHVVIRNYFTWLEMIFSSSLQANMQKIIHQGDELRRA